MTKPTTEKPILFSAPMVRALLDGRKTQTRRVVKRNDSGRVKAIGSPKNWHLDDPDCVQACPYGRPGDRLWVRETWNVFACSEDGEHSWPMKSIPKDDPRPDAYRGYIVVDYPVSSPNNGTDSGKGPWRPSIHMPKWASRITLEITDVRVERLQDISEEDARAEGVIVDGMENVTAIRFAGGPCMHRWRSASLAFTDSWNSDHGPDAWDANPWVWALTFRKCEGG